MSGTEVILGWQIRSGAYGGVPLAGVRIVAVLGGDRSLSFGDAARSSIIFIDPGTDAQLRVAETLVRERYGNLAGKVLKVIRTPVQFTSGRDEMGARVPGLLEVRLERFTIPADPQGKVRWYEPFIPLSEPALAASVVNIYQGPEFGRRWTRRNGGATGYFGAFRISAK